MISSAQSVRPQTGVISSSVKTFFFITFTVNDVFVFSGKGKYGNKMKVDTTAASEITAKQDNKKKGGISFTENILSCSTIAISTCVW